MERGDVIVDGLLKLIVALAVVGLLLFETGAVVVNTMQAETTARSVAQAGAAAVDGGTSDESLRELLRDTADENGAVVTRFRRHTDEVEATVRRPPDTVVLHRIDALLSLASPERAATADIGD
ncbi:hypothetical protein ER308_10905 [Egibacter rhizosphaerae]|uniref:Uncharacterized protein n=1 Tax=Egibacter rhizosphaerae TaxID=1670831 RepID=A0A411YFV6_9ACTN|nr:hypothetical protein [Egibacter rhizosphaerae]QBI20017.1 hypothetical protein ER308_10905 [Egibacter rhizosphaerae]